MSCLRVENYEFSRFFICSQLYPFEDNNKRKCLASRTVPKSSSLQKVSERVGDRLILTDLVNIYTSFPNSQSPVSLKMTTIASLTREKSAIMSKNLLKKDLTYSSNTF